MRWEAHQRLGFIGLMPTTGGDVPRLQLEKYGLKHIDHEQATMVAKRPLELWLGVRKHKEAPAFSGGVYDSWPAWAVDALAICREEEQWIELYIMANKEPARG